MRAQDIAPRRLISQQLVSSTCASAADVVTHLTAMQAQDYRGALWSIGLRFPNATVDDVERAIGDRTIVRTWPMRGTLHFVAAADVRWMLRLLAPRVIKRLAGRQRQLELNDAVIARSRSTIVKALQRERVMTRREVFDALERAKIATANQRGVHIVMQLSHEGLLCFGPHRGRQPTFALLDEWVPRSRTLNHDEALAELALRYFRGHGPATERDFAWWSGLTLTAARAAINAVSSRLATETVGGTVYHLSGETAASRASRQSHHLLPGFDELMLGYQDRSATLNREHANLIVPGGNGVFRSTMVSGGRVVGTWRSEVKRGILHIVTSPFGRLSELDVKGFARAAKQYESFAASTSERR